MITTRRQPPSKVPIISPRLLLRSSREMLHPFPPRLLPHRREPSPITTRRQPPSNVPILSPRLLLRTSRKKLYPPPRLRHFRRESKFLSPPRKPHCFRESSSLPTRPMPSPALPPRLFPFRRELIFLSLPTPIQTYTVPFHPPPLSISHLHLHHRCLQPPLAPSEGGGYPCAISEGGGYPCAISEGGDYPCAISEGAL